MSAFKLMAGNGNLARGIKSKKNQSTEDTDLQKYIKELRQQQHEYSKIPNSSWIDFGQKNRYPPDYKDWGKKRYPDYTDWGRKEHDDWTYRKDYKEELRKIYEELHRKKVTLYDICNGITEKLRCSVREYSPVVNYIDGHSSFLFDVSCDLNDFLPLGSSQNKGEIIGQIEESCDRITDLEYFTNFPSNSFEEWIIMSHYDFKVILETFSEIPLKNIVKAVIVGQPDETQFNDPFPPYKQAYKEAYEYYQQELVLEKLKENLPEGD